MTRNEIIVLAKRGITACRWLFVPAAITLLALSAWHARDVFSVVTKNVSFAALAATTLFWAAIQLLVPVFTCMVLREEGVNINYRTLLQIHVGRLPAKYVPGGVWHTVSRVVDLHRKGISKQQLSTMVLLENLVPLGVASTLGGFFLFVQSNAHWYAASAMAGGGALLFTVPILFRHRLLRSNRPFALAIYVKLVLMMSAFWLLAATAFFCYWRSFPDLGAVASATQIYGVYLLAWSVGFVSVFAPQGIGVFEGVAAMFLAGTFTFAGTAVVAAGFRVIILGADMLAFGVLVMFQVCSRASLAVELTPFPPIRSNHEQ